MKAAIYTRISDDTEGRGLGVARQEKDCRALADREGWEVSGIYADNDISAYSGKARPEYQRMLAIIEAGEVDAIVAWHPDRLHRSPVELEAFIDLVEKAKVRVATVQGGEYDLTTASGRMTARVVGAVARHESEHKSERLKAKHKEMAYAGRSAGGGTRPFGYGGYGDRLDVIVEEEAAVIREAAGRMLCGETLRSIVRDLNDRGVPTVTGVPWRSQTLRRIVFAPRTAGLRQYQGKLLRDDNGEPVKAEWPGILSEADHLRLHALYNDPTRRPRHKSPILGRPYLLTGGISFCGLCGAKLVARPRGDGRRCYVCATGPNFDGCGKIRRLAEPVENLIRDLIARSLAEADLQTALARAADDEDDKASAVLAELADHEAKMASLASMYAGGDLTRAEWVAAREAHASRAKELQAEVGKATTGAALPDLPTTESEIRNLWDSKPMAWRRHLTGQLIDRVVAHPAVAGRNFFDADKIEVRWRY